MRKHKGNAFIQYSIIISLVIIVCVGAYIFLGDIINKNLTSFSDSLSNSAKAVLFTSADGTKSSFLPGDLNGTADAPVSKCNNDTCILDYGNFILNGIPANFSDESTSSRGTDNLASVMQSMVEQLEAENNPPDPDLTQLIQLIKAASQKTKIIADAEQVLEIAALDVYLGADTPVANEQKVLDEILASINTNKQFKKLNDLGLIELPAPGEGVSPESPIFKDGVWINDPDYSKAIINVTNIEASTNELQNIKSDILTIAATCGKTDQGQSIAYLIDIVTQISNESQTAASNGADILDVKGLVDSKDINIIQELKDVAVSLK